MFNCSPCQLNTAGLLLHHRTPCHALVETRQLPAMIRCSIETTPTDKKEIDPLRSNHIIERRPLLEVDSFAIHAGKTNVPNSTR